MTTHSWRTRVSLGLGLAALLAAAARQVSAAEPPPPRAERLSSPGRSIVTDDTAEALVLNPANLGYLPAPEARWTGINCPGADKTACGHAFDLATPLFFGLSTGLRLDYLSSQGSTPFPFQGSDYWWLTWGLGMKVSDALSFGASIQ
ncbi:MAG TPA: hypothetical protein VGI39_26135, partial [Polyangiaceae bacterium]